MEEHLRNSYRIGYFINILSLISFVTCDEWLDPFTSQFNFVDELDRKTSDLFGFSGNYSFTENFKLLLEGSGFVIVGGRNAVYNLTLPNLKEMQREVSGVIIKQYIVITIADNNLELSPRG